MNFITIIIEARSNETAWRRGYFYQLFVVKLISPQWVFVYVLFVQSSK